MQFGLDRVGGVLAALDRALRHAGHALNGGHVADDEDVRMAGNRQIGQHLDPPCAIHLGGGLIGHRLPSGLADTPADHTLVARLDTASGAVGVLDRDAVAVDVGDHGVELDLDAHLLQPRLRLLAELLAHRRQHRGCGVEQDHPGLGRVDVPERALEGVVGELGDLAGHFHSGRTGADDDEGQQLFPAGRIAGPLGLLERAEDAAAQFQRVVDGLHTGRELGEMVVAEVGLTGAGRDDQACRTG